MRCKLYKYLYKMLPIIRWQSFLMDRHFSRCPACQNEFAVENQIDGIGVKAESVDPSVDIWSRVEERLMDIEDSKNSRPPARQKMPKVLGSWKWAWPAAAAAVLVLVFFISPGSRRGIGGDWGENGVVEQNKRIVINSIKVENRPAKTIYFQPENKNRLIVWVSPAGGL